MWHVQATCTSCYNEARYLAFIGNGRISGQQMISLNKSKYIDYLTLFTLPKFQDIFLIQFCSRFCLHRTSVDMWNNMSYHTHLIYPCLVN